MPVDTSAGLAAWLAGHPGASVADFQEQQAIEQQFFRANPSFAPADILSPASSPTQNVVARLGSTTNGGVRPAFASGGSGGGGAVGGILSAVPIIGGIIGGLLGGGSDTPTAEQQFISKLRDEFPNQNSPICGTPMDLSDLGGGGPVWLNVPCDDPGFGSASRSTVEWFIQHLGLGTFMRAVQLLLSPSPTGHPTFTEQSTAAAQPIAVNVTADAFSGVAAAIQAGLQSQVQAITDQSNALFGGIKDAISGIVGNLADAAKNLLGNLGDILKALASDIGNILKNLAQLLAKAIEDLAAKVADIFKNNVLPILEAIAKTISDILKFYQEHIAPIMLLIQQSMKVIEGAITAIQTDLRSGIKGLLSLPGDIANALSGLDASIQRAVEALKKNDSDVQSTITFGSTTVPAGGWLGGMVNAIAGLSNSPKTTTFQPSRETLTEPTLADELPKLVDALNKIALELVQGLWTMLKDPAKGGELALGVSVGLFAEMFEPFELLLFLWEVMKVPLEVMGELAGEITREIIPIRKLDPGLLTEAWKRNFIDAPTMDAEMLVQGYNGDRSKLLRDLSRYVEDAATLAEYRFRGIVTDSDFASGLRVLGFTDPQIEAFRQGNYRLLDPATATQALRRSLIDSDGFKEVLAVQRYNDADATVLSDLVFNPPSPLDADQAGRKRIFLGQFAASGDDVDTVPDTFIANAKAAGLNDDAIRAAWWGSWDTLEIAAWVNLYFRGIRTYTELEAKLNEQHIPRALHKDLIDSLRPLIPFRTIPTMVKAGILNESEGLQLLQAHGYSQFDATRLMQYATRTVSKSATNASQNIHAVSLATARSLYEDGALTEAQYREVLNEHGLSAAQVDATVEVENLAAIAKNRRETAQSIVYEFEAGLIDAPTAQQQIAALGYTQAEQAKYLRSIRQARTAKAKLPGEGDLNHMMQKSVITPDEYVAALVAQGYSQDWATKFESWRNAPGSQASTVATPATGGTP